MCTCKQHMFILVAPDWSAVPGPLGPHGAHGLAFVVGPARSVRVVLSHQVTLYNVQDMTHEQLQAGITDTRMKNS